MKRLHCCVVLNVKVTAKFKISLRFHLEHVFSTAELFVTSPGMVVHHYGLECHAKRLVCYLQGQGHSEGS